MQKIALQEVPMAREEPIGGGSFKEAPEASVAAGGASVVASAIPLGRDGGARSTFEWIFRELGG